MIAKVKPMKLSGTILLKLIEVNESYADKDLSVKTVKQINQWLLSFNETDQEHLHLNEYFGIRPLVDQMWFTMKWVELTRVNSINMLSFSLDAFTISDHFVIPPSLNYKQL